MSLLPRHKKNKKTINILHLDNDIANKTVMEFCVDSIKKKHKKYDLNLLYAAENKQAISLMQQKKEVHILITDQLRPNGDNQELDNELNMLGIYPLKILFSALDYNPNEFRYLSHFLKPGSIQKITKEINRLIGFVKQIKKQEKKSELSFYEIVAKTPDAVFKLTKHDIINYLDSISANHMRATNIETKEEQIKKFNRNWWDNLSEKWQKLFIINHNLNRYFDYSILPKLHSNIDIHEAFDNLSLKKHDKITDADIIDFRNITQFSCYNMGLTDLEPLLKLNELEILDCSYNKITNINPIHSCHNLTQLDCSFNPMKSIDELIYFPELSLLLAHNLPNLKKTILPVNLQKIQILSIADSPISFTQKTANNIIELFANYTNIPPLKYAKLDSLMLKKGYTAGKVPKHAKLLLPINMHGTTIRLLINREEDDNQNAEDVLFISDRTIAKAGLPKIYIIDDILDNRKETQIVQEVYTKDYDSDMAKGGDSALLDVM